MEKNEYDDQLSFKSEYLLTYKHVCNHRNYSGSGLGLSVVKSLVEAFGGVISLKSSVEPDNHGTSFTVKLPLKDPKDLSVTLDFTDEKTVSMDDVSAALEASKDKNAELSQLLAADGSLRSMLYSHKTAAQAGSLEHPNGISCILLCQVGAVPINSPDFVLGSYTRALVKFHMHLAQLLQKHGARLAQSTEDELTIVSNSDKSHFEQLQSLHAVANQLLDGCSDHIYACVGGDEDFQYLEVKMAINCGRLTEGELPDNTLVVHGPCLNSAWTLLKTAPSMQVCVCVLGMCM